MYPESVEEGEVEYLEVALQFRLVNYPAGEDVHHQQSSIAHAGTEVECECVPSTEYQLSCRIPGSLYSITAKKELSRVKAAAALVIHLVSVSPRLCSNILHLPSALNRNLVQSLGSLMMQLSLFGGFDENNWYGRCQPTSGRNDLEQHLLSMHYMIAERIQAGELDIYIVGTTAVGKTKLSLALAKHIHTEIVSCDSMQLYRHADIMTAKSSAEEQKEAKHHMIDVLELGEGGYNRNKFYEQASKVMQSLHDQGLSPILVGGTNYYIETLLFDIETAGEPQPPPTQGQASKISQISKLSLADKYKMLQEVDPLMAAKLHPNDQHRLDSYLRKYIVTGEKPSSSYGKPTDKLRNPNTLLFWIRNSNRQELNELMRTRIDSMVDRKGLVEILSVFQAASHKQIEGGVLQSIGYKEFAPFVQSMGLKPLQADASFQQIQKAVEEQMDRIDWGKHKPLLEKCKAELLTSTFQYAKRQVTWIKNRLFETDANKNNFFVLELSGEGPLAERFEKQVRTVALQIYTKIREEGFGAQQGGMPATEKKKEGKPQIARGIGEWKKHECEICKRTLNGDLQIQQHLKTSRHKKLAKQLSKKQQRQGKREKASKHESPEKPEHFLATDLKQQDQPKEENM